MQHRAFRGWLTGAVCGAACAGAACADDALLDMGNVVFSYRQPTDAPAPAIAQPDSESRTPAVTPFGAAESKWWTVGAGVSAGFNGSTDTELYGSYSYFLAQDVEFAAELGLWYFNQSGDNAAGASASMVFRWHFVNTGPWTVYADLGIGILGATDSVPDGGTGFDLMPRASVGFTRLLSDDGLRLQVGLGWHHISNARIEGDENNPARDQAMIYAGLIFPF